VTRTNSSHNRLTRSKDAPQTTPNAPNRRLRSTASEIPAAPEAGPPRNLSARPAFDVPTAVRLALASCGVDAFDDGGEAIVAKALDAVFADTSVSNIFRGDNV